MSISGGLGRGNRSKGKTVSKHLESAHAGEGSAGQTWLAGEGIQPPDGLKAGRLKKNIKQVLLLERM